MSVLSYKELTVWQKSFELAQLIYGLTRMLPEQERFGISSQIQRSAVSIPSNIAEGAGRHNTKEFIQFLGITKGSLNELETQLLLIQSIYRLDVSQELELIIQLHKMLFALTKSLKEKKLITIHCGLATLLKRQEILSLRQLSRA